MKIRNTHIVRDDKGKWQILYATAVRYFITTNGAFGQRETSIEEISYKEAWNLLEKKTK